MDTRVETVVIGGGQAGLSVSHHLAKRGREHVVLERGQVGETWRSERWDSFLLNTPNWFLRLPGHEYAGSEREAFLTKAETVAYLEQYADKVNGTVQTDTEVTSLRARVGGGFAVETSGGRFTAANVVVATGSFRQPAASAAAGDAAASIFQLHANQYLNPQQLPDGGVLVVGSGQSGCQIAAELNRAGRDVYLSLGRCPSLPFLYRGRRIYEWAVEIGMMDETADMLPSPAARFACNPTVASEEIPHLLGPERLAREGVTLVGRVESVDGTSAAIRPDANERLADARQFGETFKQRLDDYVLAHAVEVVEDTREGNEPLEVSEVRELDLDATGVRTILWANGFRPDFRWIELPVCGADGWPLQTRGVSEVDGLYFVGVHWLHKRKSALLLGVGEDAEHVVSTIVDGKRTKEDG
jgi:putative flavoprotein involved in K+ transport